MKNLIKTLVASLVILLLISCGDKYNRDRYVGDWEFMIIESRMQFNNSGGIIWRESDTIYYSGEIIAGSKEEDILIKYTENDLLSSFIDTEGEIYIYDRPCSGYYCSRGHFEGNNKMYVNYLWGSGPNHFRIWHRIYGIKK